MAEKQRYQVGEEVRKDILKWKEQIVSNNERLEYFKRIVDGEGELSEGDEKERNILIANNAQLQSDIARAERGLSGK